MHSKGVISRTQGQEDLSVFRLQPVHNWTESLKTGPENQMQSQQRGHTWPSFLPKTTPPIPTTDSKTLCLCGGVVESLENSNSSAVPVGSGFTAGMQGREQFR